MKVAPVNERLPFTFNVQGSRITVPDWIPDSDIHGYPTAQGLTSLDCICWTSRDV